jgi:hypothetical protein
MNGGADASPASSRSAAATNGSTPSAVDVAPANPGAGSEGTSTKRYVASLSLEGRPPTILENDFAEAMLELEKSLGMPLWFLIQNGADHEHDMCGHVEEVFFRARHDLPAGKPIALLIESPGGDAAAAYSIAKMLQRHCGSFTAIIAQWAKSAATLLALGASEVILAEHAQLGPLDAQFDDYDREERTSALDETQAVERLHAAALEALDQTILLLARRTSKRMETIMPLAMKFTSDLMRPLFEKVDVVQYTARQRTLKVAEEYAIRLLRNRMSPQDAKAVARHLVEKYPEHGFMIDYDEASEIGLPVKEPTEEQGKLLDRILLHLHGMNAFGRVVAV